ncbi:MAG: NACHT domain-containing protein [Polyangiaceae bacterium]
MSRYSTPAAEVARLAGRVFTGAGVVLVPPGEQEAVATAIRQEVEFEIASLGDAAKREDEPFRRIVVGLGARGVDRVAHLSELNARRGWFSTHDQRVILVVDLSEMQEVQEHAADLFSARAFFVKVPFEPDPSVDEAEARAALGKWLYERFGRIDLRGLIRRESQDVAFGVEELYQELRAYPRSHQEPIRRPDSVFVPSLESRNMLGPAPLAAVKSKPITDWFGASGAPSTTVLLGAPGAGKSFFLRWLSLCAVREEHFLGISRPVPVLMSAAAFSRTPSQLTLTEYILEGFLADGLRIAHCMHAALGEGRAFLLVDGLDEVASVAHRDRVLSEVRALRAAYPKCPMVVTSRPIGYPGLGAVERLELVIAGFEQAEIRRFLLAWTRLYARERLGPGRAAEEAGAQAGAELVDGVLANPGLTELSRSPLLLTVVALVHRLGVRLPDHRVELYDQITQVLVERWNRVRSASPSGPLGAPPLKAVDAVRLLGPAALRMIESSVQGNIPEPDLRRALSAALESGSLRGVATVDEAVDLFRDTLGILVEVAPGFFAFAHQTLAEYFAAWELVRSDGLEKLVSRPVKLFDARYREVLLLALGVLGLLRGDDQRLASTTDAIARAAEAWEGRPKAEVPALLMGLLRDDPNLGGRQIERLVDLLVPGWLFERFEDWHAPELELDQDWHLERLIAHTNLSDLARTIRSGPAAQAFRKRALERLGPAAAGLLDSPEP